MAKKIGPCWVGRSAAVGDDRQGPSSLGAPFLPCSALFFRVSSQDETARESIKSSPDIPPTSHAPGSQQMWAVRSRRSCLVAKGLQRGLSADVVRCHATHQSVPPTSRRLPSFPSLAPRHIAPLHSRASFRLIPVSFGNTPTVRRCSYESRTMVAQDRETLPDV